MKYIKRLSREITRINDTCSYLVGTRFVNYNNRSLLHLKIRYSDTDDIPDGQDKTDLIVIASNMRYSKIIEGIKNWGYEFKEFALMLAINNNDINVIRIISNWNIRINYTLKPNESGFFENCVNGLSHKMIKLLVKIGVQFSVSVIQTIRNNIQLQYKNLWRFRYDEKGLRIVFKEYVDERYKLILLREFWPSLDFKCFIDICGCRVDTWPTYKSVEMKF